MATVSPLLPDPELFAFARRCGARLTMATAPAAPSVCVEETWVIRVRPVGPSGRAVVEARAHRRDAWCSDPLAWPQAVRDLAQARRDGCGRAVSRRPFQAWKALEGARAKAHKVVEVALRAVRQVVHAWQRCWQAAFELPGGRVTARIPVDAPPNERARFMDWMEQTARRHP